MPPDAFKIVSSSGFMSTPMKSSLPSLLKSATSLPIEKLELWLIAALTPSVKVPFPLFQYK